MPRELKFRSDATRSAAIGTVMAIALGGSMVLAYALATTRQEPWTIDQDDSVQTRPVNIGPLALRIPEYFQRIGESQQRIGFDLLIEFDDRLDPKRRLQIAALGKPRPENTLAALTRARNIMLTEEAQQNLPKWTPVSPFRGDETIGAWHAATRRTRDTTQIHLLGVLTGKGQRYWMIYFSHEIDRPELLTEATESILRLFGVVMEGATWRNQPNRGLPNSL